MAANSIAVGTWTVVGRLTGLGRLLAVAAVLGPTFFGNLFQAANTIPNLLYEFLAGNLIISLLVPRLTPHADASDMKRSSQLAGQFLGVVLTLFALVAVVVLVARPLVLDFLSIGVDDPAVRYQQRDAGMVLLALLLPQVLFYAVAGVGMAVQHAHGRYRLATAAYSVENIGVMLVVMASGLLHGTGVAVGEVTSAQLVFLGVGTTGAVVLHGAVQWWGAYRVGVRMRPRLGWRSSPDLRHILRLGRPSIGYAAMNALRWITLIAVAGSIPGGVVAFTVGLAFFALATAVGARPVAWAMVPHLSRLHQGGDHRAFQLNWGQGLSMSISVVAPAIAGIYALSSALPQAVSFGEMAGETGTALVMAAMLPLAAAILGETVFIHASHGSYARSDARGPLIAMALRVFLTLIGLGVAVWVAEGRAILIVMGSTVAIADLLSGGFLGMRILRKSEGVVTQIGTGAVRAFLASGIMALPIYLLSSRLMGDGLEQIGAVLLVVICAAAGAGIYVVIQHTRLRTPGFGLLARQARTVFRRTAP